MPSLRVVSTPKDQPEGAAVGSGRLDAGGMREGPSGLTPSRFDPAPRLPRWTAA